MDTPLLDNVLLRGLLLLPGRNDSTRLIDRANNVGRAPSHTFSLSLADANRPPPVPKQNAPSGRTITGAVEFCDLILLKGTRSLATTFCFVKGEPLRSPRPVPGNQYSQFDRIHGPLPAGAPVVHATGHRLRIVLWRILVGPSNRLYLRTQLSEGSSKSIRRLPPATRNYKPRLSPGSSRSLVLIIAW